MISFQFFSFTVNNRLASIASRHFLVVCDDCAMKLIYVLLSIAVLGSQASEAKFSVLGLFPHPALSHFRAFQPLLRELAERGHDVFVVSHFPEENAPENYRDFVLDQSQIITAAYSVEEVSLQTSTLSDS